MKKSYIYIIIFMVLAVYNQKTIAQINTEKGEYIPKTTTYTYPCDCTDGIANFKFINGFDINLMLANERAMQIARKRALRAWYNKQTEIIKKQIEKKLGKHFSNYEDARNDLFRKNYRKDIEDFLQKVIYEHYTLVNDGKRNYKKHLRNIKLLKRRLLEVEKGNINNSIYGNKKVGKTFLKDFKDINILNKNITNEINWFENAQWKLHNNKYTYEKILSIRDNQKKANNDFEQFGLNEAIKFYNKFDEWDRLTLIQLHINYDEVIKQLLPPRLPPKELVKFTQMRCIGPYTIINYAKKHRDGGLSVFDPNFPNKQIKKSVLIKLLNDTPINANTAIDFLIDIDIAHSNKPKDINEIKWLNENPKKAIELQNKFISINGSSSIDPISVIVFSNMIQPEITKGGKIVAFNDKVGITDYEQRQWLYNHTEEYERLNTFYNYNKQNNHAGEFMKGVVRVFSNNNLNESEKFSEFSKIHDKFDPKLPPNLTKAQCEAKIRHYAKQFNRWGNKEFGNYLESLLPLENGYSQEEYYKLYEIIREKKKDLCWDYFKAITGQVIKSFEPVIEAALWEMGSSLALKILTKLPIKYLTTPIKNVIKRLKTPTSTAFSKLKHAKKYGIKSYKELGKTFKELGLKLSEEGVERHHLIEKRFFKNPKIRKQLQQKFGKTTDDWLCIIVEKTNKLTKSEHYKFTEAWRLEIGIKGKPGKTGFHTRNVPFDIVIEQARKIYKDYPEILKALGI